MHLVHIRMTKHWLRILHMHVAIHWLHLTQMHVTKHWLWSQILVAYIHMHVCMWQYISPYTHGQDVLEILFKAFHVKRHQLMDKDPFQDQSDSFSYFMWGAGGTISGEWDFHC